MITYKARRDKAGCSITANGDPLLPVAEPREYEDNFPTVRKFAWGDDSEASRYLAFCILDDYSPNYAHVLYLAFHQDFIKQIRDDEWQITNEELDEGIKFWSEMMRPAPLVVGGEPMRRVSIPHFIYRVLIKRVKRPGGTVTPEQVDEAMKVTYDQALRLCMMVERAYLPDLLYLREFKNGAQREHTPIAAALFSVGFVSHDGLHVFDEDDPLAAGLMYSLNIYGTTLLEIRALDFAG